MVILHLYTNKTPRRYFGSAPILTFPPRGKNLSNPFSYWLFGVGMCDSWMQLCFAGVPGATERESSATRSSRTYS
jgi:hypothetical protein